MAPQNPTTSARTWIMLALALSFCSLFLSYTDVISLTLAPLSLPGSTIQVSAPQPVTQTGFKYSPLAVYFIIGLFLVYQSRISQSAAWQRYGYWISFVALLISTPWYKGFVAAGALLLAGWAAIRNGKERKQMAVPAATH